MEVKKIQISEGMNEDINVIDTNVEYEITLAKNSSVTIYDLQTESHDTNRKITVNLEGGNSKVSIFGLYILKGVTKSISSTAVNHLAMNCSSEQIYKAVCDDKARGSFEGKIYVAHGANGTIAHQESKNLLLSDTATVSSTPSLEIYTDDVKCSHGAASGMIDPEAYFYMQARGIGIEKAKELLTFAFAKTIIDHIKSPEARHELEIKVKQKLEKSCLHIYDI